MELESGTIVKLLKPKFTKTFGQGEQPKGLNINTNDDNYFIPWGTLLKVSDKCDEKNKIANLDIKPRPLIRLEFVLDHINSFKIINISKQKESEELK